MKKLLSLLVLLFCSFCVFPDEDMEIICEEISFNDELNKFGCSRVHFDNFYTTLYMDGFQTCYAFVTDSKEENYDIEQKYKIITIPVYKEDSSTDIQISTAIKEIHNLTVSLIKKYSDETKYEMKKEVVVQNEFLMILIKASKL